MTLLENKFPVPAEEFAEERLRKKHSRTFEDPELVQCEKDSCETIFEKDPYSELRFCRK